MFYINIHFTWFISRSNVCLYSSLLPKFILQRDIRYVVYTANLRPIRKEKENPAD